MTTLEAAAVDPSAFDARVWAVVLGLGAATYLIRFSFLGALRDRAPAPWAELLLRYVPTALLPALAVPMALFPSAADGALSPERLAAAATVFAIAWAFNHVVAALIAGLVTLWTLQFLGL